MCLSEALRMTSFAGSLIWDTKLLCTEPSASKCL
jgi:hypothetical protein